MDRQADERGTTKGRNVMGNILVVAAHPDDEVLGCGGTLARHAAKGDVVTVLIVAEGATARGGVDDASVGDLRLAAAKAAVVLGCRPPVFLGLPDNRLDGVEILDVIKKIEQVIEEAKPDTIYTHRGTDLNIDHRIIHEAVVTACRPVPGSRVKRLYCFETVSSTEWSTPDIGPAFQANRYVDISDYIDQKTNALDCYEAEMRPFPHARSVEAVQALAIVRGTQAGLTAAEAFITVLEIE
jgi:N-acetylglucosamine malate deacetylase 1